MSGIEGFLTRTGRGTPAVVEPVPLRGPRVGDTILGDLLGVVGDLVTGRPQREAVKREEQARRKAAGKVTGPTMRGVTLLDQVNDLLGGRAENTLGEGPVSTAMNWGMGEFDPSGAGGGNKAALIPKIPVARTEDIVQLLRANPQRFNTTQFEQNAEHLNRLVNKYRTNNTKLHTQFDELDPRKRELRADFLTDRESFVDFNQTPEDLNPFVPEVQRVYKQIAKERPDLVLFADGAKLERPSNFGADMTDVYGDYTTTHQRVVGSPSSEASVRINNQLKPKEQIATLIHEFEHADTDRMGMFPKNRYTTPYDVRIQELSARGNEPLDDGTLPDDVGLLTRYLTGFNSSAGTRTVKDILTRSRTPKRVHGITRYSENPYGDGNELVKYVEKQIPEMNINLARAGEGRGIGLDRDLANNKFRLRSTPVQALRPQQMDLRPLLESIMKLPRY